MTEPGGLVEAIASKAAWVIAKRDNVLCRFAFMRDFYFSVC